MAITINGAGTITGLSTGGLPDGSVDADTLASSIDLGKVLQIVQGKASIQVSTTSTSYTASGLNVTITPSSTSSKVLILGTTHANAGGNTAIFALYRDDTTNIGSFGYQSGSGYQDVGFTILDTPSTTSATEYEVYYRSNTGSEVYCAPNDISHYIIAIEIAG